MKNKQQRRNHAKKTIASLQTIQTTIICGAMTRTTNGKKSLMGINPLFSMGKILNIFDGKKSLIFSMGRNPQYFHSEEILNIFNEEILTILNRKKFSIFPMGRNPRYFQWEEILHIFNRKRGATHPKHTSHASFASPRHFSLHSHELLVFI